MQIAFYNRDDYVDGNDAADNGAIYNVTQDWGPSMDSHNRLLDFVDTANRCFGKGGLTAATETAQGWVDI